MPYISTFIYCENIQNENTPNGPKMHIIEPMHIMTPAFIPSMFSFCIVFGILNIQLDRRHILRYVFKGAETDQPPIIDTGEIVLPIQEKKGNLPDDMNGIMMNMDFRNIPLQYEGSYNSEIFVDGTSLGIFPIKVKGMMQ